MELSSKVTLVLFVVAVFNQVLVGVSAEARSYALVTFYWVPVLCTILPIGCQEITSSKMLFKENMQKKISHFIFLFQSTKNYNSIFKENVMLHIKVIGITPTLHVLCSESFPAEIRATSNGIVFALQYLAQMLNVRFFPIALSSFGFHPVAYFYATVVAAFTIWGWLTIKDTDKLSLSEIQGIYRKEKKGAGYLSSYGNIPEK